jgi:hypothetical protein
VVLDLLFKLLPTSKCVEKFAEMESYILYPVMTGTPMMETAVPPSALFRPIIPAQEDLLQLQVFAGIIMLCLLEIRR